MIRIDRGPEPADLAMTRQAQLQTVSAASSLLTDKHREAYRAWKHVLAERQRRKYCYCERIMTRSYNDVEHYRPSSRYWWLAWTWESLLFACAQCNRSGKNDAFPMAPGSVALQFGELPPGAEQPLMLDPAADDPRRHIRFVKANGNWLPIGLDERGRQTLRVLRFDDDYHDHVQRHAQDVITSVGAVLDAAAVAVPDPGLITTLWRRTTNLWLAPEQAFLALTEDVLRHEFPSFPEPPAPQR